MQGWISLVNTRQRRALGCAPTDRITPDRRAMLTLPAMAPATGWRSSTRLARDHYVRVDSNDYSVHPGAIGRRIEVITDLARVHAVCDGRTVADHERVWAWHQSISDPGHVAAANALRAQRVGVLRPVATQDVEQRALADYDTALGTEGPGRHGGLMTATRTTAKTQPQPGTCQPRSRSSREC
jgi:transposase